MAIIRGIQFQAVFAGSRLAALIAQRPDAVAPTFEAVEGAALIYQVGTFDSVRDAFANEESKIMAEELGMNVSVIWRTRKALGVAEKYGGDSRVTAWRAVRRTTDAAFDFAALEAEYLRIAAAKDEAAARREMIEHLAAHISAVLGADAPRGQQQQQLRLAANALFARLGAPVARAAELRPQSFSAPPSETA